MLVGFDSHHFYDAFATNAKFYVNVFSYGHADLLDEPIAWAAHLAKFCSTVANPVTQSFQKCKFLMHDSFFFFKKFKYNTSAFFF